MNKNIWMLPVIFTLFACGGGDEGGGVGDGGSSILPSTISWSPPTQNTDDSALDDLAKYRFYYGPDATLCRQSQNLILRTQPELLPLYILVL